MLSYLVRGLTHKGQHSADIFHAGHLGAQGSLRVKVTLNEVTVFSITQFATAMDTYATRSGG